MKTTNQNTSHNSERIEEKNQIDVHSSELNHEENRKINEARELLKALSQDVKPLVDSGKYSTINEAIMETIYKDENNKEFKSYRQWNEENYQVRKGEKAYLLWGRPKENQHLKDVDEKKNIPVKEKENDIEDMHKFFPVAYIFSNTQVDPREQHLDKNDSSTLDEIDNIRETNSENEIENDREI